MVCVEICYDCPSFTHARTAIIHVREYEGWTYITEYFKEAKKKLFGYLSKEYGIEENEVLIHDWKYHGHLLDVLGDLTEFRDYTGIESIEPTEIKVSAQCLSCGMPMGSQDNFCPNCGKKVYK